MAGNIQNVGDNTFQAEVIEASKKQPVMVDFWAEWCRPCHMLAPTVQEIANDYSGRLKVVKMNVDENMHLPADMGIRGIPTMIIFHKGQEVERAVGAMNESELRKKLDQFLIKVT